jgi:P4 family phage/plasmid primase-like protien
MHPTVNASLGLPSSDELKTFRDDARKVMESVILDGPAERLDGITKALESYVGKSHPAARADILKDAMDACGGVLEASDWTRIRKAFNATLDGKAKAGRREAYRDGMARGVELTEAFWVEAVAEDCLHGEYIYSDGFGWMKYTGRVWKAVSFEVVADVVRDFTARRSVELMMGNQHDPREISKMLKGQFFFNVTRLCQGYPLLLVDASALEAKPDLLNCLNGTVDLRTGQLRPHNPHDYLMKCAPTEYKPGATDAAWDQALSAMDTEVIDWMQVRYGNGITGHVADNHTMCFLSGTGGNGKSMHLDGIRNAIGSGQTGYFAMLSDGALVAQNPDKEAIMSFRGARLAVMEELPSGRQLNESAMKKLLGTGEMRARHLYKSEVSWTPSHSLFVTSNYELSVSEADDGTWRRLVKVPFPYTYVNSPSAPHERLKDHTLSERLGTVSAREAALAWLVAGAIRWYERKLGQRDLPRAVGEATEGWRGEADFVFRFFKEHLIVAPGHHIAATDMLKAFNAVMAEESQAEWSQKTFSSRAKGHTLFKGAGIETAQVRPGRGAHPVASRRNSSSYGMDSLPARYMAFMGVRFRTDADDVDEAVEADPVPATGVAQQVVQAPVSWPAVDVSATGFTQVPVAAEAGGSDPWTGGYLSDSEWLTE